jgi:predicted RNase H-like nuclease (RuvC/YqgF family)
MSGLNISIINNAYDALKYIEPKTDAENVLYDLLKQAEANTEVVDNDVEDLKDQIDELESDVYRLERENEDLLAFFDKINDAYNEKLGISRSFDADDDDFLDEIIGMIKEAK